MKGHKDSSGKFHPHSSKKVLSSKQILEKRKKVLAITMNKASRDKKGNIIFDKKGNLIARAKRECSATSKHGFGRCYLLGGHHGAHYFKGGHND